MFLVRGLALRFWMPNPKPYNLRLSEVVDPAASLKRAFNGLPSSLNLNPEPLRGCLDGLCAKVLVLVTAPQSRSWQRSGVCMQSLDMGLGFRAWC